MSKIYERCTNKQLQEYFQELLSKHQCGFWKSYNVINALRLKIEEWKESFYEGGIFRGLLSDLSKPFPCSPHELLISKRHTYRIDIPSLKMLHLYLTKKGAKLNSKCSSWSDTIFRVLQGPIFRPLLLKIIFSR